MKKSSKSLCDDEEKLVSFVEVDIFLKSVARNSNLELLRIGRR